MSWARSSPFAGVVRVDRGLPAASVRRWSRRPVPCRPYATPSPPPWPGGKGAIHSAVWPVNQPMLLGQPEHARLHRGERPIDLPARQPPLRSALGGPRRAPGESTPAAAGAPDVEPGIDDLTTWGLWHATPPLGGLRRNQIGPELPRQVASSFECSGHGALLTKFRTLSHGKFFSGIASGNRTLLWARVCAHEVTMELKPLGWTGGCPSPWAGELSGSAVGGVPESGRL